MHLANEQTRVLILLQILQIQFLHHPCVTMDEPYREPPRSFVLSHSYRYLFYRFLSHTSSEYKYKNIPPEARCFYLLGFFNVCEDAMLQCTMEVCHFLLGKLHNTLNSCIQGIIFAFLYVFSWVNLCSTLSNNNLSGICTLTVSHFHAKALSMGITAKRSGATRLFMCHIM